VTEYAAHEFKAGRQARATPAVRRRRPTRSPWRRSEPVLKVRGVMFMSQANGVALSLEACVMASATCVCVARGSSSAATGEPDASEKPATVRAMPGFRLMAVLEEDHRPKCLRQGQASECRCPARAVPTVFAHVASLRPTADTTPGAPTRPDRLEARQRASDQ
jgi:hypothetical protein